MFLKKYLNEIYLNLIYDKYEEDYITNLDKTNFEEIYQLFKKYNFYFIEDIIITYLEIFTLDKDLIEQGILRLKEKLGENFVFIIGNNLRYLEEILINIE